MISRIKIITVILVMLIFSCSESKMRITNNNSSIEYDKNFTQRVVKQSGEVFYDVTKGESPFFVKTDVGEIQVLGTKFNLKSNMHKLELEVEEGVVELKINKFISKVKKGQKAFFKENEKEIKIYKANFKHKKWIKNVNKEINKLGKEISKSFNQIEKESKKNWKEVKKK
jgi:hypothetical protein